MQGPGRSVSRCRVCGSGELARVLSLGKQPSAHSLLDDPTDDAPEFPLVLVFCRSCSHVQLDRVVPREHLVTEYPFLSSASDPVVDHFSEFAATLRDLTTAGDTVVDIGSNDGTLLGQLPGSRTRVGVEPATVPAEVARDRYDFDQVTEPFGSTTAAAVRDEYGRADVVTANFVLSEVDGLEGFAAGVADLLAPDGRCFVETKHLLDVVQRTQFDTFYHLNRSYWSLRSLRRLLSEAGLEVVDGERSRFNGRSIRVEIQHADGPRTPTRRVDELLELEAAFGLDSLETYERFATAVERKQRALHDLVVGLNEEGATVVGYGAPAKATVLLNACGIGADAVEFVTDTTPIKQGKYVPGVDVPIRPPDEFDPEAVDYALLLAWNYREEILEKESRFRRTGGRFVVPAPHVDVV